MPVTTVPVIITNHSQSNENATEIAICQALPTRAETLVCLQKLKESEDFAGAVLGGIFGGILLLMVLGFVGCWIKDKITYGW